MVARRDLFSGGYSG